MQGIGYGIKGIRRYLASESKGYHVTVDGAATEYYDETLRDLVNRAIRSGYELTGVMGNVASFRWANQPETTDADIQDAKDQGWFGNEAHNYEPDYKYNVYREFSGAIQGVVRTTKK